MALGVTHNSSAAWAKPPRRAAASNAARACMGGMRRTGGRVMGRLHHRGRRAASGTDRTNPRGVDPAGYGAGPIPDLFQPGPKRNVTNLDGIFKIRDITLPTKVRLVKAMVFPVVMYGCETWTVKKAERRRIDAFELWCWRILLRVP